MSRAHADLARAATTSAPSSTCVAAAGTALRARSPRQRVEYHPMYLTKCSKRSGTCRQSISSHCAPGINWSALQALVQVRAVHDHSRFREISHLLQRKRRAQHVLRELLAALGVAGANAHAVVDGEAAVAPGEHARRQPLADGALGHEQLEHFRTKALFEQFHGNRRKHDEYAVGAKNAISSQHMEVRVEGHQIAECLHEQDQSRSPFHLRTGIGLDEQSLHDMAQLPEQSTPARKNRPQHPGYGEDILPVRYWRKNV